MPVRVAWYPLHVAASPERTYARSCDNASTATAASPSPAFLDGAEWAAIGAALAGDSSAVTATKHVAPTIAAAPIRVRNRFRRNSTEPCCITLPFVWRIRGQRLRMAWLERCPARSGHVAPHESATCSALVRNLSRAVTESVMLAIITTSK